MAAATASASNPVKTAVVMMNMGGPENLDGVHDFLLRYAMLPLCSMSLLLDVTVVVHDVSPRVLRGACVDMSGHVHTFTLMLSCDDGMRAGCSWTGTLFRCRFNPCWRLGGCLDG
jgi:hypothetical protein